MLKHLILATSFLALLTACQGGGSRTDAPAPVTPPVTPPPSSSAFPGYFRYTKPAIQAKGMAFASGSAAMSSIRIMHLAVTLQDGRVALIGGQDGTKDLRTIDIYDPTTETVTTPSVELPESVGFGQGVLADSGEVLTFGGSDWVQSWDPTTNEVKRVAPFSQIRRNFEVANIGNHRILIYGGYEASSYFEAQILDTQTWETRTLSADQVHRRQGMSVLKLSSGKLLISGGHWEDFHNSEYKADIWVFDPSDESFTKLGDMQFIRAWHTMLELPNGKIEVFGGWNGDQFIPTIEEFDLTTKTSVSRGSLTQAQLRMKSFLLPNGLTVHMGGWDGHDSSDIQMIFDPATGANGYTGAMKERRDYFTATALANGKLLIAGGWNNQKLCSSSLEIFEPEASLYLTAPYSAIPLTGTLQLTAKGATTGLTWSTTAGTIDSNGLFTAPDPVTEGADPLGAYITVTNEAGVKAVYPVSFIPSILTLRGTTTVVAGTTQQFTALVAFTTDQGVTWEVDKGTIDATGLFTAPSEAGTVNLTLTPTSNPKMKQTFKLTITAPPAQG